MAILDTFVSIFEADTEDLKKGYDQAKKTTDEMSESLKKVEDQSAKTTESIGSLAKKAASFFLAYVAANASVAAIVDEAASIRALDDLSYKLNDSIENVDAFNRSMQNIGVSKSTAESTLISVYDNLKKLGINANSATDAMFKLSDKVSKLDDKKAKEYLNIVGITDPRMIDAIRRGRGSLQDMMTAQKELGVTTKESSENALAFDTAVTRLNSKLGGIKSSITGAVMPAFTYLLEVLANIVDFLRDNEVFTIAFFSTLSAVLGVMFAPAMLAASSATWAFLSPILAIVVPILAVAAAIAVLVDDIWNFIEGNDSFIGRIIEDYPVVGDILTAFGEVLKFIGQLMLAFVNLNIKAWKMLLGWFTDSAFGQSMIDFFKHPIDSIIELFDWLWEKVTSVFDSIVGVFDGIKGLWNDAMDFLGFGDNEVAVTNSFNQVGQTSALSSVGVAGQLQAIESNPLNAMTTDTIKANNVNNDTKVTVGDITISTQATDAKEISQAFKSELESQLEALSQEYNTGILK